MDATVKNPLISPICEEDESGLEVTLRPAKLTDYIGQEKVKSNLAIFIEAARKRREALDHVLLYGPPGLGKTTLAYIIAREMGVDIKVTSGPVIERPGDLAAILTNMHEHEILFIDEIHRLSHVVEEILYPAMEDYHIDILIGQGPSARSMKLDIPQFTLVGATTRAGSLTSPLRDRFGMHFRLEFYYTAGTRYNHQKICFHFGSKAGRCRSSGTGRARQRNAQDCQSPAETCSRLCRSKIRRDD